MKVRTLRKRFYRKTGGPRQIGLRCKDYGPGCIVCESYQFYYVHGRFPSFDEAHERCLAAHEIEEQRFRGSPLPLS